ncbi:MAG: hypothetical protein SFU27_04860 [Thermonemataceae bacterium]|nr:hypothetical protein [Thermonemataceae bacterium]
MNLIEKVRDFVEENSEYPFELRYALKNDLYELDFISNDYAMAVAGAFFEAINQKGVAEHIGSLHLFAEDEGANGINEWDIATLLENAKVSFKNLKSLYFPLNTNENHNRIIVTKADMYEENGGIGEMLLKMPALEVLQIPSAPSANFFEHKNKLKVLRMQVGLAHRGFVKNLSTMQVMDNLEELEIKDYSEFYIKDYQKDCIPKEDYFLLFESQTLPKLKKLTLENTLLSVEEQEKLKEMPLAKQLEELNFKDTKK